MCCWYGHDHFKDPRPIDPWRNGKAFPTLCKAHGEMTRHSISACVDFDGVCICSPLLLTQVAPKINETCLLGQLYAITPPLCSTPCNKCSVFPGCLVFSSQEPRPPNHRFVCLGVCLSFLHSPAVPSQVQVPAATFKVTKVSIYSPWTFLVLGLKWGIVWQSHNGHGQDSPKNLTLALSSSGPYSKTVPANRNQTSNTQVLGTDAWYWNHNHH